MTIAPNAGNAESMTDDHDRTQFIDALEWRIARLDGQSGALIHLRAELSPTSDIARRQLLEHQIDVKIADIAELREILNEMTGMDAHKISKSEL